MNLHYCGINGWGNSIAVAGVDVSKLSHPVAAFASTTGWPGREETDEKR